MSIEQPEFEIDIDANLDRKTDELLEGFQGNKGGRNNFDSLLESTNDAVLSNDIHYKARLCNMLLQKTGVWSLSLSTVDNYKARLYGLALEKMDLVSLRIEGANELDDAGLLVDWVRNCNLLRNLSLKSIKNEGVLSAFLQAAHANSGTNKINIKESHLTPSVIQTILDEIRYDNQYNSRRIQKEFHFDPCLEFRFESNRNRDDWEYGIKHINDELPTDLVTLLTNPIQHCTNLKKINFDSITNEPNDLLLLDAVVANTKMEEIIIQASPISDVIIPMILNKSKSLKGLKVGQLDFHRYAFEWCSNQDHSAKVTLHNINNNTARFYANFFPKIVVRNLVIAGDDEELDDAPQLMHFIRNSSSLESIELWNMSNERGVRELLLAATQNVKITKISTCKIPPIQDLIPRILETSKSLTHLSMCGFSLDCSELGKEAVSIEDVDNRTIFFYVPALTKRRLTELEIISDNGLDDGRLLIEWIKHSGSLKKFRCCSMRNEVVCRELLEAAVSNPNVEHLYLEGKCMRFLSIVLNQSESLRCLELDERDDSVSVVGIGMSQASEFPLFEEESLSRLFKKENQHVQSRSNMEKLVLHCWGDRHFENVVTFLKENGRGGTFFSTVELKLKNVGNKDRNRLLSSLPTMRGVHELEISFFVFAKNNFLIAMLRKNFCLHRLDLPNMWDYEEIQNDIKMLCKRNGTIQNWADVGYSMPKQYLYRTLLICQMYEFWQEIIFDLLKKYWCRRADHVHEAHALTNCSSSDKIQRKRKRLET